MVTPTASETRSLLSLLKAGVPMERVSVLLGHSSIKVTEKHYSPWVRARQEQLEADVAVVGRGLRARKRVRKSH